MDSFIGLPALWSGKRRLRSEENLGAEGWIVVTGKKMTLIEGISGCSRAMVNAC